MENEEAIMQCLILLKSAYPRMAFGPQSVATYQRALADIDPELLRVAVLKHISISKWFPTIAELRQAVTGLILEAEGQLAAPEAWGVVMREVRRVGHWRKPELSPLVQQAVEAVGGWRQICFSENIAADRARFLEAYTLLQRRAVERRQQMPAVSEAQAYLAAGQDRVEEEIRKLLTRGNGRGRGPDGG
jgi:hypothetical protein